MEHFARFHAANIYREPRARAPTLPAGRGAPQPPQISGRRPGAPISGVRTPFPGSGQGGCSTLRPGRSSVIFQRPVPDPSFGHVLSTQQPALDPGSAVGRTWLLRGARGKPRGEQRGNAAEGDQEGPPETGTQGRGAERGPAGSRVQGAAPTKAVTPQRLARSRSCARPGVPCAGQKVTLLPPSKSSAGLMTQLT